MPKMVKKGDLPSKLCAQCGLPFAWRKKWARVWEEVRYCSDRCRSASIAGGRLNGLSLWRSRGNPRSPEPRSPDIAEIG